MTVIDFRLRPPVGGFRQLILYTDAARRDRITRMHGFELVRRIRARFPNLPVIIITAAPEPFAPLHERIDGYLAKPFRSLSALRESVADAFERSRVAQERQDLQRRLNEVVAQLNQARRSS